MNHALFFVCPVCFSEDSLHKSRCVNCHAKIHFSGNQIAYNNTIFNSAEYYDLLLQKISVKTANIEPPPEIELKETGELERISQMAVLRQATLEWDFRGYHRLFNRIIEEPQQLCDGHLLLYREHAEFRSESGTYKWHAKEFSCITTNGHYFEFKVHHRPFFQIRFLHESPLKYEIIFRKWLLQFHQAAGNKKIVEFQPRITFAPPERSQQKFDFSLSGDLEKGYILEIIIMLLLKALVIAFLRLWIKVQVISRENWDTVKSGFTILNHQSGLDPFIVGAFLDRKIAFLTKNTAFNSWLPRLFLRWNMGVPTTRYRIDPPVIYYIRRLLKRGIKIGIFPEGERTWGGRMHPFKMSVVKLLMASREAITPIVLKNAFDFLPRWAKMPRRGELQIIVGAPFCLIPEIYPVVEQKKFLEDYFRNYLKEN